MRGNKKTATEFLFKMPQKSFEEFLEGQQSMLPKPTLERDMHEDQELRDWAKSVGLT